MGSSLKNNGLSVVLLILFLLSLCGQYLTGWQEHNEERVLHGRSEIAVTKYVTESHFLEALFENWESEFLQMGFFVILTVFLYQKGSAESKSVTKPERVDMIKPKSKQDPAMPAPVRRGGLLLRFYSYSLSIALFGLFSISFVLHGIGGLQEYNSAQVEHGQLATNLFGYMTSSTFWFESFQNWQSEFLSIAVMVIFTIFLRQRGSPESKPVDTPHSETAPE